jgi:hypothetical protein
MCRGFSYNGKTLLSGFDPAGKADRAAEAASVQDRTLYLCPSPLYGYGLERLLNRITANSGILCIEANPDLFAISQEHIGPLLKNNHQLRLTNRCDTAALCTFLRNEWGPRFFRRVEIVRFGGGWQLSAALYETLAESLQQEIAINWGNAMTLLKLGRRYICNTIRNLTLYPRFSSLERLNYGSQPVLVLGAGPSLDQTLDGLSTRLAQFLRSPSNRPFKIICVDTCLSSLKERGIKPDLEVILESQHWNLDDFIGLAGWEVPAAMDLSALPRSGDILSGGLFRFFTPWTELTIFKRLNAADMLPAKFPPLGSVGLSAVSIARCLTIGTIITAGLDFSFTLDSYHARSTPGHKNVLHNHNRFRSLLNARNAFGKTAFTTNSKVGNKVYSNLTLLNYRDLFEREFNPDKDRQARNKFIEGQSGIFDIADNGLPLNVKTLSLEAAFEILASKNQGTANEVHFAKESSIVGGNAAASIEKLQSFIHDEQERLKLLRNMLAGEVPLDYDALATLIDECDYLWAHFPDYAASDQKPGKAELENGEAISFLKRLRVEIDPFLKLWELTLKNT